MIPAVLKNFLNSEKAVAAGVLAAIATVFVFTNRITVQEWMNYTEVLLAIYVGGKALQGGAAALAQKHNLSEVVDELATRMKDKNDDDTSSPPS